MSGELTTAGEVLEFIATETAKNRDGQGRFSTPSIMPGCCFAGFDRTEAVTDGTALVDLAETVARGVRKGNVLLEGMPWERFLLSAWHLT